MSEVEPLLRVVRGDPTPEELAALVTVVLAGRASAGNPAPSSSAWLDASRPGAVRGGLPVHRGRQGWRASALPR